jgi:rhodanese-related sulfurtransferase
MAGRCFRSMPPADAGHLRRHHAPVNAGCMNIPTLLTWSLWPFRLSADRERLRDGLEKAGVPASSGDEAESPVTVEGAITVDAAQAKALFDRRAVFIDVRTVARWNLGHIPDAILLDLETDFTRDRLRAQVREDEDVVIYCEGPKCLRSSDASHRAVGWGFRQVHYFRNGFPAWKAEGYSIAVPPVN